MGNVRVLVWSKGCSDVMTMDPDVDVAFVTVKIRLLESPTSSRRSGCSRTREFLFLIIVARIY